MRALGERVKQGLRVRAGCTSCDSEMIERFAVPFCYGAVGDSDPPVLAFVQPDPGVLVEYDCAARSLGKPFRPKQVVELD